MVATRKAFDFDMDARGAHVVVGRERLGDGCRSDGEIDARIAQLKAELDAVASRMKAAIKRQSGEPVFIEGD